MTWNYSGGGGGDMSFPTQSTGYSMGISIPNIFKTTNFGANWIMQQNPVFTQFYQWKLFFPNINTGYACGKNYIIKTTNGGINWLLNYSLPNTYNFTGVFFTDTIVGYIVGYSNGDTTVFLKTTDGGSSWSSQFSTTNPYGNPSSLFFINANTGMAGSSRYIYKTTDSGLNWFIRSTPTANSINSIYFSSIAIGYGACSGGQIIKTTDGGDNWYIQYPITTNSLYAIFFINDNTGYACGFSTVLKTTNGGGPPIGIKPIGIEVPKTFSLSQNYPNPFNPVTTICYDLPISGYVKLTIFDILGREIKVLINEKQSAGKYEAEWDGSYYTSGIYFYRLEVRQAGSSTGDFVTTKKMVLLK